MRLLALLVGLFALGSQGCLVGDDPDDTTALDADGVVRVDFDKTALGTYTWTKIDRDWPGLYAGHVYERGEIRQAASGSRFLRMRLVGGVIGPTDGGGSFKVGLEPGSSYSLSYRLRFSRNFAWTRGGKLPGLAGGSAPTGGAGATQDGFSVRLMWREGGAAHFYVYHPEQKGRYGTYFPFSKPFVRGSWMNVRIIVDMGTPGRRNGRLRAFLDGEKVADYGGIMMRAQDVDIDTFLFSNFFGGSDLSWAPPSDQIIDYDRFVIERRN